MASDRGATNLAGGLLDWLDRWRVGVFAAMAALYVAGFQTHWRLGPDSALYLTLGRSLARGEGFTHHLGMETAVPPGLPLLAAGTFRLAGEGAHWLIHLALLAMAMGALGLVYALFRLHADRPTAVLMVLLTGLCETVYRYSFQILNEAPFFFGMMLLLVGWELVMQPATAGRDWRRRGGGIVLVLAGLGVMAAFRSVVITVLAAVAVAVLVNLARSGRWRVLAAVALAGALLLAGRLVLWDLTPDERLIAYRLAALPATLGDAITNRLPYLLTEATPEALFAVDFGPVPGVALSLMVYGGAVLLWRRRTLWGALVLMFVAQWLVFLVVDRYFLPLVPLLIYGLWRGMVVLGDRWPRWRDPIVLGGLVVLTVSNSVMTVKVLVEQRTPDFVEHYGKGRYVPVLAMAEAIRERTPPDAVLVVDERMWAVLGYVSDRDAVPPTELDTALGWGRPLFAVRPLPEDLGVNSVRELVQGEKLADVEHPRGNYALYPLFSAGKAGDDGSGRP